MKIHYTNCGGWTPMKVCDVDTSTLPAAEAQLVEALVARSNVLQTAEAEACELCDADEHTVEVTTDSGTYFWQWYGIGKPEGPPALIELLDYLSKHAYPDLQADNEASF